MLYQNKATDKLTTRPQCDICASGAAIADGKTTMGPWAYMCAVCFGSYATGLGMGVGQILLCGDGMDASLIKERLS